MHCFAGAAQVDPFLHVISEQLVPMQLSTDDVGSFQSRTRSAKLGVVQLLDVWTRDAFVARRTTKLIARGSAAEYLKIGVQRRGGCMVSQAGREVTVAPGDLMLYDTTCPYTISSGPASHMQTLLVSRDMLRLSPNQVRQLTTHPMSGRDGLGALLTQYLAGVARQLETGIPGSGWHLADAMLSLLSASLSEQLAAAGGTDFGDEKTSLLLRVKAYIEHRLHDPDLSIANIAAAQHISPRTLQKLFELQDQTPTGWIRTRRLEHCRRDLANPALLRRTVREIAASWGLFDAVHFSHLFKATYGLSPREYRTSTLAPSPGESQ
ncbi:hypothetical protein AWB92_06200 [Mycobacterium sp. IEC1808]|nr:hypothetical protein AWB92_06200 [Mycobacterium sp. IEC1808]